MRITHLAIVGEESKLRGVKFLTRFIRTPSKQKQKGENKIDKLLLIMQNNTNKELNTEVKEIKYLQRNCRNHQSDLRKGIEVLKQTEQR